MPLDLTDNFLRVDLGLPVLDIGDRTAADAVEEHPTDSGPGEYLLYLDGRPVAGQPTVVGDDAPAVGLEAGDRSAACGFHVRTASLACSNGDQAPGYPVCPHEFISCNGKAVAK
jgi:hypothetical protein